MLVAFAWATPLDVPLLPAGTIVQSARPAVAASVPMQREAADVARRQPRDSFAERVPGSSLFDALAAMWAVGAGLALLRLYRDRRRALRLRDSARPAAPEILDEARALASRLRVAPLPIVRVSNDVRTPQVIGTRSPAVLLPARRIGSLSLADRRIVLCHELVHVRRRDLWLAWVPAIASRIFFFNPVAHLAAREYLLAREAACDAEVLRLLGTTPQMYGRLLLSLGVERVPELAAAGGSRTFRQLERRLLMLGHVSPTPARRLAWVAVALVACALLPVRLTARPASYSPGRSASAPVAPAIPPDGARAAVLAQSAHTPAPASPAREAQGQPVVASPAARYPTPDEIARNTRDYAWIILSKNGKMHMNGWGEDAALARRQQHGSEPLLWARRAGEQFVIRDPALIAKAQDLFEPVSRLGAQQAAVGRQQAALGRREAEMGARQGAIGARQGEIGAEQAAVGAQQAALAAEEASIARQQAYGGGQMVKAPDHERRYRELDAQMKAYEQRAHELEQQMDALRQPMEDLAKQMEPLARQQQDLGAQMETLAAQAEANMRKLIDQAIAEGKAERVR
jgi:beta-lactamase regulating signal transducer with metallopeptidase domain